MKIKKNIFKKILKEILIDDLSDSTFVKVIGTKFLNFNKVLNLIFSEVGIQIPPINSIIDIDLMKSMIKKTRKRKLNEIDDVKTVSLLKVGNSFYILDVQYYGYGFTPRLLACFDSNKNLIFISGSLKALAYNLKQELSNPKNSKGLKKSKPKPFEWYFKNNLANDSQKKKQMEIYKIGDKVYSIHLRGDEKYGWYVKEFQTSKMIVSSANTVEEARKKLYDYLVNRGLLNVVTDDDNKTIQTFGVVGKRQLVFNR